MIWLLIIVILLCFLCWLLISPIILEIDSRVPGASLRWVSIGRASIWYDKEWRISFRVFFYHKERSLDSLKGNPKRIHPPTAGKRKKKPRKIFIKMARVIRSFRVEKWRIAVDTGDFVRNAQIYPLNFLPPFRDHVEINFRDDNYLYIRTRNKPLRILYAFLR